MEEILYTVHELGIFEEFMSEVKKIRINNNEYKSRTEIYEIALDNVLKKKSDKGLDIQKN